MLCLDDCFATTTMPQPTEITQFIFGQPLKEIELDLPPILSKLINEQTPVFIYDGSNETERTSLVYFRDRLFLSERPALRDADRAEVILRIKKAVYGDEAELASLRAAVANVEAAIEFQRSGPKRDPIPEDVKLLVWARDGGCCVRCGANQDLHFDHIIPINKGGGNSEQNIQILCQLCNLKKSDKITFS
jgi:hypothetical protein